MSNAFMISRRRMLQLAGASVPVSFLPGGFGSVALAAQSWDLACEYNATSYPVQLAGRFAEELAQRSGNALTVKIHPGASLGYKSADQFYAVADGALAMAFTLLPTLGGIDPLFEISTIPFMAVNLAEAQALTEIGRKHLSPVFEQNNQRQLFTETDPGSGIWAKRPIESVADLQGLRIRTFDANSTRTMEAAGAVPFQLAWADVVPQLAAGAIDAVLTSAEGGALIALWEHTPFFNELNYSMSAHAAHVNLESLNALPEELQEAVLAISGEIDAFIWENQSDRIAAANKRIADAGTTVVDTFSDDIFAHLRKAGEATLDTWLVRSGDAGRALLDEYRAATL